MVNRGPWDLEWQGLLMAVGSEWWGLLTVGLGFVSGCNLGCRVSCPHVLALGSTPAFFHMLWGPAP
jgi:hypothetical protein